MPPKKRSERGKLSNAVLIPLVIAVLGSVAGSVVAFVLPALFPPSPAGATLGVDSLSVSNPTDLAVQNATTSVGSFHHLAEALKPTIDMKLHNDSDNAVDLTEARLVVEELRVIAPCVMSSAFPLSATYDIQLPTTPGATATSQLNEEIPAHSLEHVAFRLDAPVNLYGGAGQDSVFYRLGLQLMHDGDPKPFDAGSVDVVLPGALTARDFYIFWGPESPSHLSEITAPGGPQAVPCDHRNTALLASLLTAPAARSPEVAQLASEVGL